MAQTRGEPLDIVEKRIAEAFSDPRQVEALIGALGVLSADEQEYRDARYSRIGLVARKAVSDGFVTFQFALFAVLILIIIGLSVANNSLRDRVAEVGTVVAGLKARLELQKSSEADCGASVDACWTTCEPRECD